MSIEKIILANLQYNEDYARQILPFIKPEYFSSPSYKECFLKISEHFLKYDSFPSKDELLVNLQKSTLPEQIYNSAVTDADDIYETSKTPVDATWLRTQTETYCKDRSLFLALQRAIDIADGTDKNNLSTTAIPDILSEALSLNFATKLGHDYFDDFKERYDYYVSPVSKIPFRLDMMNTATEGGVERKTLNIVGAQTGGGKSLFLTNISSDYIKDGYNVLYISLEMTEKKIAQRIDANLLNVNINELKHLPYPVYENAMKKNQAQYKGRVKVVEFPPHSVSVANLKVLLREYKTKFNFIPDVIIIDYLGICASARMKIANTNSYMYYKSVAEELRAFAIENDIVMWSALQLNRGAMGSTDVGMENTSDSIGGPMTFDFYFALIVSQDMIRLNQVKIKQLKSRYGDLNKYPAFVLGLDRAKMKFYDLTSGQTTSSSVAPVQAPTTSHQTQHPPVGAATSKTQAMKQLKV